MLYQLLQSLQGRERGMTHLDDKEADMVGMKRLAHHMRKKRSKSKRKGMEMLINVIVLTEDDLKHRDSPAALAGMFKEKNKDQRAQLDLFEQAYTKCYSFIHAHASAEHGLYDTAKAWVENYIDAHSVESDADVESQTPSSARPAPQREWSHRWKGSSPFNKFRGTLVEQLANPLHMDQNEGPGFEDIYKDDDGTFSMSANPMHTQLKKQNTALGDGFFTPQNSVEELSLIKEADEEKDADGDQEKRANA